tara:strand:+ start:302 stop:577 length:276 start_codon:yes stop_codon:yes gene_type:complete
MEEDMLVEGLGSVTLVNGLLRVQLVATDPSGNLKETGQLEIPANRVVEVVNGLAKGAQDISDKINETNTEAEKQKKEKGKSNGSKKDKKKK